MLNNCSAGFVSECGFAKTAVDTHVHLLAFCDSAIAEGDIDSRGGHGCFFLSEGLLDHRLFGVLTVESHAPRDLTRVIETYFFACYH